MKIGDKIPEFLGLDQNGQEITADQFRGRKLVLYVYPKDSTSGCTAEACSLRDHADELAAKGYAILGVSRDTAMSHRRFIEKYDLPFSLIADTDTTLLQQLDAWGEKKMYGRVTMGTLRTTYLVNEDGIVTHIFTPRQIKTSEHAQQILSLIEG